MSAQHTPGPWLRDGLTVYSLMHAGWRKGIEQLKNRFYVSVQCSAKCSKEEAEANARLISAAPEMLAALMEADSDLSGEGFGINSPYRTPIRAAIAKATGAKV